MSENLKATRDEQVRLATAKYRELLARADQHTAKDKQLLQDVINTLNLSDADLMKDAEAFDRAADLRRDIVPEADILKIEKDGAEELRKVEVEWRRDIKEVIDAIPLEYLPITHARLCAQMSVNRPEITKQLTNRTTEATLTPLNARQRNDDRERQLQTIINRNPRVFA